MASSKRKDWQLYGRLLAELVPQTTAFLASLAGYALYALGVVLLADLLQFLLDALGSGPAAEQGGGRGIITALTENILGADAAASTDVVRQVVPAAIVVLALLRALGYFAGSYFMNKVARNMTHDLRCKLFDATVHAPSDYFDRFSQGALLAKFTFNVEQVSGAVTRALRTLLRESLVVASLLSYMLYLNWRLCLVFLVVTPLIAVVVIYVGRIFRRYSRGIQDSMGDVARIAAESVAAHQEIRLYRAQRQQLDRFGAASNENRKQSLKLAFVDAVSTPVIQTLLAAAIAVLVWFALGPDMLATLSAGSLAAFLVAAVQLGKPVRQLSAVQSIVQRGLAAAEDIFEQLDQPPEADRGTCRINRMRGDIELRNVSFSFSAGGLRGKGSAADVSGSASPAAIHDVSLRIPAGQSVALVGPSGGGKTSLLYLLARVYAPTRGTILLDDRLLEDIELASLRANMTVVPQHAHLFQDSVRNNVAFGELASQPDEAVRRALAQADALEFVVQLPQGLDTVLGGVGEGLSGGQRQRLVLARAFLKSAPVLLLDEATAALDNETESRVRQSLRQLASGCTLVVVAHRLHTLQDIDRILVLDQGRIVADGEHEQLLRQGGLYAQLYQRELRD